MVHSGLKVLTMGNNFERLLNGLWVTISISIISVILSIILGTILGIIMRSENKIVKAITKIYLEFVRIMPQLVLLFIVYFGFTTSFGLNLTGKTSAIIVFTFWGTAEMGDLVRGALNSIPKHQYDSASAIGLSKTEVYRYIIIPQTLRRLIPLAINLTTRIIKTTTLVVLIGVEEVLKVAQQIIEANRYEVPDAALWIYVTIFILYFVICFPISKLASLLERRWNN
ncbi:amino acid ABC transporter permease [Peptoniphilus sp. MSJ-1]|uniref:Amino acid ABC transporter permease n=1 Tax=Peptoniphilus ovalis TaxID=2841503 RepID=A0ABS6FDN6_9FIRM|nr:amino acid ABC transporter permease [Peptoniphilus ovalis]MBU5668287.1 amino acid ABC transporter permease [Peptoniphilus ovalis]